MTALRDGCAAALAGALALAACAGLQSDVPMTAFAEDGTPLGRLPADPRPMRYALDLRVDPSEPEFSGVVTIEVAIDRATSEIRLHGDGLDVTESYLTLADGGRIEGVYTQLNATGSALLALAETAPRGTATLHLAYTSPFNTANAGLFRQERDGAWYAATQFEPVSARLVFPGFDQPDFKTVFDVAITARTGDVVITNSPETAAEDLGEGWTRHMFEPSAPLPTYLLFFGVGPYDLVESAPIPPGASRAAPLPLRGAAVRGQGARFDHALAGTAPILAYLEDYFDVPYPYAKLDLVAMPSSFGGAMENAGAIAYDEFLILLDGSAPVEQRMRHTYVHAHEVGHMWFGDYVTPAWWSDIWLNESFATWIGQKTARSIWTGGEFDLETQKDALGAMAEDSLAAARRIREPVLRDADIASAFDSITYQKGGGVLAMLEAFVGEDAFREGVRTHMRRFPHDVASTDDFMESIAAGAGNAELVGAFRSFIDQPGVPLIEARLECPARGSPRVRVHQSRYRPLGSGIDANAQLWRIPACVAYSVDGTRGRACALVTRREQSITLDASSCPDSIHPNAQGAGYYRFALDEAGWTALAAEVAALPAAEALATVDSLDAAFRAGAASAEAYVGGLRALLGHPSWEVAEIIADRLEKIVEILDENQLESVKPYLAAMVRDRYASLAGAQSEGEVLLRAELARFLAIVAEDPEIRGDMTALAAERIGVRGAPDWSRIEPDLLSTTLSVGVQELDARFFDALLEEALGSNDPTFRREALGALARVEDPALAARFRDTIVSQRLRGREAVNAVARQLARDDTEAATWAWIQQNAEAVIEVAPETFRSRYITALGVQFCSTERSAEFAEFIVGHADLLPGYERNLAQAQEKIALCAALRAASADALSAALTSVAE
jgi:alanyl aminopeptidase